MTGRSLVLRADAHHLPLADSSVDLVVTSPPYFGLRSYQDGGEHYAGQVGAEATPAEFIDALLAITAECVRVLKPSGSIWVNLGDKYAQNVERSRNGNGNRVAIDGFTGGKPLRGPTVTLGRKNNDVRTKSLIGLPWRYALRCIDDLGLILRAEVVWSKPNGLPESVTDRVRRSHEQWFHFTKEPRYFSAVDEVREEHAPAGLSRRAMPYKVNDAQRAGNNPVLNGEGFRPANPLGKLPGSVWTIPTAPLTVPDHLGVDHFAAFPPEFPKRIISGWSPRAVCQDCGFLLGSSYDNGMHGVRGRDRQGPHRRSRPAPEPTQDREVLRPDVQQPLHVEEQGHNEVPATDDAGLRRGLEAGSPDGAEVGLPHGAPAGHGRAPGTTAGAVRSGASPQRDQDGQPDPELGAAGEGRSRPAAEARGEAVRMPALRRSDPDLRDMESCPHCGGGALAGAVIADVFGGTGTTAMVARALGRTGISVDLSADYCRLGQWRTGDAAQRAKVRGEDFRKPEPQIDGQVDLFGGAA